MSAGPFPQHPPTYLTPAASQPGSRPRSSGSPYAQAYATGSQLPPRLG
jgi:hypothetical protein